MSQAPREKKTKIINQLQEAFAKSSISILTDYRGLTTAEMTNLRRKLQESGGEYKVVKNTLAQFAAQRADKEVLSHFFAGPIAIAFGYSDIIPPTKVLADYIRGAKTNLSIKAGLLGNRLLSSEEVMILPTLPSKEILVAKILGQMKSPVSALLSCLTTPMQRFIGVLQARMKQLEGA